jgi:hypothetical protein
MPVKFHLHTGVKSIGEIIPLENFLAFSIAIAIDGGNIYSILAPLKNSGSKYKM